MRRRARRLVAVVAIAAGALTVAACSSGEPRGAAGASGSATPSRSPAATTSPTPHAAPTCASIISASTVASLRKVGWSAQSEPFTIDDIELTGGLQCTWGDAAVASEHVQIYGWAPITRAEAKIGMSQLLAAGWRLLGEHAGGSYITAGPGMILDPDGEGYGMTYLFGDGWVKLADTKQGLLLVDGP